MRSIKKSLLIRLMRILGFGGMAAYCIAGCSNQTPNQSIQAADDSNASAETLTPSSSDNYTGPRANSIPLSDKEIDQLLDKYNYKKVNDYTTVIEKKEGMALTFTYIWAKSKSGNKIRFPDTFKAIVQRTNGNYYAVFSDGTMDSIQNDFFENFSDNDYKRCTTKYACDEPGGPYSYVYEMTNRKPIGE